MRHPHSTALACLVLAVPAGAQNPDCNLATPIGGAGVFAYSNVGGSSSPTGTCGQMGSNVFFSWTPDQNGSWTIQTCDTADYDTQLAAFTSCAGAELACDDDFCGPNLHSLISVAGTAGTPVIIAVGGWSSASGTGAITTTFLGAPSGNDACVDALPISGSGSFFFDNTSATTDGPTVPCTGSGSADALIEGDLWYAWTSDFTGTAVVRTCGLAGIDTMLAVYADTSCPVGTLLSCSDDACGLQSQLVFDAGEGQEYLVRVGTWVGSTHGSGQFEISEGGPSTGCDSPGGPDVIVAELTSVMNWGTAGSTNGYSFGATACNVGDSTMPWEGNSNHHPLIAQNLYRLMDGRFEQVGMSWMKHGFGSAVQNTCCVCINPGNGQIMGIGCGDTYGASTNGQQGSGGVGGLGPRSDVDPWTGLFPFPYSTQGQTGDAVYKRLQVENADLDPASNTGALYFGEVQYITPDDAIVGNQNNNTSHRVVNVTGPAGSGWNIAFSGADFRTQPAIFAWQREDPDVMLTEVSAPNDGLLFLGSRATDNRDGTWRYEYALHNENSQRSAGSFSVPLAPSITVTNMRFHDVDSHSGEIYDSTDWTASTSANDITWSTLPFSSDPDANALRWGTLYNFSFDANAPPQPGQATIGLFRPGSPGELTAAAEVPSGSCLVTSYCVGAPNSAGTGATLAATGSTSISAGDMVLEVHGAPASVFGLFFYGPEQIQVAFGNGFQCVGTGALGTFRLGPPSATDGTGTATRALDFTVAPLSSGPGSVDPGSTTNFQFFYRDLAGGGSEFNLSDALNVVFCP